MSIEPAAEVQKELPKCGRLVFRGVELAYLNIDGEYMLPLAELLALVLPTTPRATVFTRMEKMKVRRHFCKPDEIKLLKTVNGINGLSANCTLISKTEVDKYCSMYIDDLNERSERKCSDDFTNESEITGKEHSVENYGSKGIESTESAYHDNTKIQNKLTVLHKQKRSSPLKAKLKLTKICNSVKLKSALSPDSQCTQTSTDNARLAAIDSHLCSTNREGFAAVSSELLSSFQAKSPSLLKCDKLNTKKRDRNSQTDKKKKLRRLKKRPSSDVQGKQEFGEFESPLKIPKRSELNTRERDTDKINEQCLSRSSRCSLTSQPSQRQEFDCFISASSSNDSGFASTVLSNASSPTKRDFIAEDLSELRKKDKEATKNREHSSPRTKLPKLKTPTKNEIKRDDGNSLTLSPPALLLKRYENSWQVEQKSPVKEATDCSHKSILKTEDKGGSTALVEEACGQTKQVRKRRKRRKPLISQEVSLNVNDSLNRVKPDSVHRKKIAKREQKAKLIIPGGERTCSNGEVIGAGKKCNFLTAKVKKSGKQAQERLASDDQLNTDKQSKDDLLKKNAVLDRIVGDALAKFFGPKPSSVSPESSESQEPAKPKPIKTKVAGPAKPFLQTNSKFKLLNLFPATSQLGLENGSLCPVFTMSCPRGFQPPSSHPVWNWRLGGPVFRESTHKFLKPKPVSNPKQKFVCDKVRKIKRRRRRKKKVAVSLSALTNNLTAVIPVPNVLANHSNSASKATEKIACGNSDLKPTICVAASNTVSSESEIAVS